MIQIDVDALAAAIVQQMQGAVSGAPPKMLTIQQVAEALSVSDKHVRSLVESGDLEAIDIGTSGTQHLRISQASLEAYIARRKVA